jgi:3-phenylpropionate/trans-cinnamate dioxygenase ferredoxin subunit
MAVIIRCYGYAYAKLESQEEVEMSHWIEVGKTSDLVDGQMKAVKMEGRQILVAKVGDRYLAADNRCPHLGGNLSAGTLEGTIITCPLHHSQFDLTDGHVVRWTDWTGVMASVGKVVRSPRPIRTYAVRIEGDAILVEGE